MSESQGKERVKPQLNLKEEHLASTDGAAVASPGKMYFLEHVSLQSSAEVNAEAFWHYFISCRRF